MAKLKLPKAPKKTIYLVTGMNAEYYPDLKAVTTDDYITLPSKKEAFLELGDGEKCYVYELVEVLTKG
jgi:hypothetical protein